MVAQYGDAFAAELGLGTLESKRSAAFVLLVLQTELGLSDEEALDGVVEGSGDFGIDALPVLGSDCPRRSGGRIWWRCWPRMVAKR